MKIIIFGGTGLIGQAILNSDWIKEYTTVLVSRKPGSKKGKNDAEVIPYVPEKISFHFKGNYAVINLAGAGIGARLWTKKRKARILSSRIRVTKLISELVNAATDKPALILQASAVGYYGSRADEVLTEESTAGSGFLAEICRAWEDALYIKDLEKTRLVYLRTGLVLSREAGFLSILNLLFRLFLGGYTGDGKQWMPWIHIRDEVSSIRFLLENKHAQGPYNLVAPNPVRMKYFFTRLGKTLNRPSWLHIPSFVIRMIPGGFGEELLLSSQFVQAEKLIKQGYQFEFEELENALKTLYQNE